jgi:hypothetical protein
MTIIDESLGAELLGALASTLLFGVTIVQLYSFASSDYKSQPKVKALVALVG